MAALDRVSSWNLQNTSHVSSQILTTTQQREMATKNIWIAAGDGDIDHVKMLVEQQGVSPNAGDDVIGYTPMHAAASYGRIDILQYLISKGGDVNITDEEGDTPLYTVESVPVAEFLVEHGAEVDITNSEGVSPAQATEDDWPEVAAYIRSKSSGSVQLSPRQAEQHELTSEEMTEELITRAEEIIARAEREGWDPHEEVTKLVEKTVFGGMVRASEQDQDRYVPER